MRTLFIRTDHKERDNYGGVGYYRCMAPAKSIGADTIGKPPPGADETFWDTTIKNYDVVITKHIDQGYAAGLIIKACEKHNKPLLLDFDDDFTAPDGPARFLFPEGSAEWRSVCSLMESCTALTVSTEPLVKAYEYLNKPIHLIPNGYPEGFPKERKHWDDGGVTIGWTGSLSHLLEYDLVAEVCRRLWMRWGTHVQFSFLGCFPDLIKHQLPRSSYSLHKGMDAWEGYPQLLADQGFDIGIAPLKATQFNAARSLIKWFEYSLLKIPTVASNWGPYKLITHNQDGLLCSTVEEWVEAISTLIAKPDERDRLAQAAYDRVLTYPTSPKWREVCERYIGRGFHPASS
jgi:glycosyltransferase involved in cell wall biosynthesis